MSLEGLLKPVHLVIFCLPTPAPQEILGGLFWRNWTCKTVVRFEPQNAKRNKNQ